jgi:hypothetical protein
VSSRRKDAKPHATPLNRDAPGWQKIGVASNDENQAELKSLEIVSRSHDKRFGAFEKISSQFLGPYIAWLLSQNRSNWNFVGRRGSDADGPSTA